MTVNTHLSQLGSSLVLSEVEKSSILTSIRTLKTRLDAYFGDKITNHFQFGSSTRGTILPRKADKKSDIDYMIIFDTSDGQKKPQTYLDRLRKFAEIKYSTSEISQSHPTIVLSLNHIKFELVPAIYQYTTGYLIPSPSSLWLDWMATDPSGTNQALQNKNGENYYQIKPLVRLVKYWNACNDHPFRSFLLEEHIIGKNFWLCTALKDYFYSFWDEVSCTHDTAQYIKDIVERAKKHAKKAKNFEDDNMPISAELEIKKIVPEL